ncbi:uncharacterized protein LOC117891593 [Drosophila subobscura]|uniref:uncharacterized protein LOC117891593 n=1 Tax=Drosophila subobscura TaxID=7241 RepID=UPI00155B2437|nr:uncharacterized protein LOC117891593 [Drosophila subobscura]
MWSGWIVILLSVLYGTLPAALKAAKCKAAPKSVQNVQICCPAPMANWAVYNSECRDSGQQPSCRLDCIFNASSVLQGSRLRLDRVRPMLQRAFNQQPIVDAYRANFGNCSTLVYNKYQELTGVSRQSDACDRHALFYSLCAYFRLMQDCPAAHWQRNNKMCQEARSYTRSCFWPAFKSFMNNT